jgi:hypothetical protein
MAAVERLVFGSRSDAPYVAQTQGPGQPYPLIGTIFTFYLAAIFEGAMRSPEEMGLKIQAGASRP